MVVLWVMCPVKTRYEEHSNGRPRYLLAQGSAKVTPLFPMLEKSTEHARALCGAEIAIKKPLKRIDGRQATDGESCVPY
jgi:hypothetical protein